ncbi:beta-ketoacyl synthase [Bacteroidia bacterium]|nr:beta-ketoacyl synthase [Bacteroidia bacterium]
MIVRIGDNIISSLGFTTEENYQAVKSGRSGLKFYDAGTLGLPEAFTASLIDKQRLNENLTGLETDLEKASILSVISANNEAKIDLSSEKVLFIFSSTKGNVDLLESPSVGDSRGLFLWQSAQLIAGYFNNPNTPIVVSNACISGAAAQIAAMRELASGLYDYAVVIGADMLSKFIISGFQSFKALSPEPCRPFDADRTGLNLGEAAATIIYANKGFNPLAIQLLQGAIRNDATHISAPSRAGEGSYLALKNILQNIDKEQIAFVNAHGTATLYNDEMESIAIARAGLDTVPVNSLKAYFGHTLGAAGVLESIISMHALKDETIFPTLNFHSQDFENQLNIPIKIQKTNKKYLIKMLSGFGGVNAALIFEKS